MPVMVLGAALGAVAVWSGTVIVTKLTVAAADPIAIGAWRTILAGLIALPLALRTAVPPRDAAAWRSIALSALGAYILFPILFTVGTARTSAAHAGLVMAVLPVLTGMIAALFDRRWPRLRWWLGCLVAFLGTASLISGRFGLGAGTASLAGDLLVLASCVAAAFGYVVGARASRNAGAWPVTLWGLVLAALALLAVSPLIPGFWSVAANPSETWLGIGYLAVFSSIIGYALWYWALSKGDIARNGTVQFLQPVLTLGLAVVLLAEALSPWLLLSAAVILLGVRLAQASATAGAQPSSPGDERAIGAGPQPVQGDEP